MRFGAILGSGGGPLGGHYCRAGPSCGPRSGLSRVVGHAASTGSCLSMADSSWPSGCQPAPPTGRRAGPDAGRRARDACPISARTKKEQAKPHQGRKLQLQGRGQAQRALGVGNSGSRGSPAVVRRTHLRWAGVDSGGRPEVPPDRLRDSANHQEPPPPPPPPPPLLPPPLAVPLSPSRFPSAASRAAAASARAAGIVPRAAVSEFEPGGLSAFSQAVRRRDDRRRGRRPPQPRRGRARTKMLLLLLLLLLKLLLLLLLPPLKHLLLHLL